MPSLVLVPALDGDVVLAHLAEGADERGGQSRVGDERDVEVDGGAADLVAVAQLALLKRAGDVDHHVDLPLVDELQGVGELALLAGLAHAGRGDAVVLKEFVGAGGGIELVALAVQHHGGFKHVGLLPRRAARQQDAVLGDALAYRQHRVEQRLVGVFAQAANLAGRDHVDAQHGVGLLQA